jgi:dethiobiotin synthetase
MVPLNDEFLLIDYLQECNYPVILVANGVLGSINHTLMSLEICAKRGIDVAGLIFNHFGNSDPLIIADTLTVFANMLHKYYPNATMVEVPIINAGTVVDYSALFPEL